MDYQRYILRPGTDDIAQTMRSLRPLMGPRATYVPTNPESWRVVARWYRRETRKATRRRLMSRRRRQGRR